MDVKDVKSVKVNNQDLKCVFCGSNKFWEVDTLLNEKWFAAFDVEIWSKRGKAYICDNCGYKHEFISKKGIFGR